MKDDDAVRVAHATVPGRIRLRVARVYRDEAMKIEIERELAATPGVRRVRASALTATVLVIGEPALSVGELLGRIDAILGTPCAASPPAPALSARAIAVDAPSRAWHRIDARDLVAELGSSERGLDDDEARRRLLDAGPNALAVAERRSALAAFAEQLRTWPIALLSASAVVSLATGGIGDAIVIAAVVLLNASIGYATESQAERIIASLGRPLQATARVLRGGAAVDVATEAVVPGDVLVLGPATFVAADARLLATDALMVDESMLTGESVPVTKSAARLEDRDLPLGERVNLVFRGTLVTGGSGLALVVATGGATEIGRIQRLAGEVRQPETPLQQQLDGLSRRLVVAVGAVCGAVFAVGLVRRYPLVQMLKMSVSLAVAAIPEGLPTVAITTLALGVRRMHARSFLVRRLPAVETLGAVQVMCFDKTGTITRNRMTTQALHLAMRPLRVEGGAVIDGDGRIVAADDVDFAALAEVVVSCSEVKVTGEAGALTLEGTPTECALVQLAIDAGVDVPRARRELPLLATRYRSESRSFMSTLHDRAGAGRLLAVKGRPADVLAMCSHRIDRGALVPLTEADREAIAAAVERMATRALRVLGAARHEGGDAELDRDAGLTWLGAIGMSDPPREGMRDLIARFHRAGIDTVMITGDQGATARAVAEEIGLARSGLLEILDAIDLERLDPDVLSSLAERVTVFCRVSPAHKLRIVQALQRAGKVVAMTGDGVNDSPALRAADVGVAMGMSGTTAARDMADVVLEDDELATMITGIEQGRAIYDDIRKAVHFMLSKNLAEIVVAFTAVAAGLGEALTPMQLLWLNLLADVFPELALGVEPPESDVLLAPPRPPGRAMFDRADYGRMAAEGGFITVGTLLPMLYGLRRYGPGLEMSTLTVTTLTYAQLLHTISSRSRRHTIFDRGALARNDAIPMALGGAAALHLLVSIVPGARKLLSLAPLAPVDWGVALGSSALPFFATEIVKWLQRSAACSREASLRNLSGARE